MNDPAASTGQSPQVARTGDSERDNSDFASEQALTPRESEAADGSAKLSSLTVYSVVLREGEEELNRPTTSLWWSGVAAGVGICMSVLAEAAIRSRIDSQAPYTFLVENLGYTFGFALVILARLQLFTENTITVVLPVLADPTRARFLRSAKMWGIVLAANFVGTFLTSLLMMHGGLTTPEVTEAVVTISHHVAGIPPLDALARGIPAGFLIAAIVWMMPSAKGSELLLVVMFTWLIAIGDFTHVVAGSHEVFNLVVIGDLSVWGAFFHHILPVLVGNVVGGTGLFALLAYGQVREEM